MSTWTKWTTYMSPIGECCSNCKYPEDAHPWECNEEGEDGEEVTVAEPIRDTFHIEPNNDTIPF